MHGSVSPSSSRMFRRSGHSFGPALEVSWVFIPFTRSRSNLITCASSIRSVGSTCSSPEARTQGIGHVHPLEKSVASQVTDQTCLLVIIIVIQFGKHLRERPVCPVALLVQALRLVPSDL